MFLDWCQPQNQRWSSHWQVSRKSLLSLPSWIFNHHYHGSIQCTNPGVPKDYRPKSIHLLPQLWPPYHSGEHCVMTLFSTQTRSNYMLIWWTDVVSRLYVLQLFSLPWTSETQWNLCSSYDAQTHKAKCTHVLRHPAVSPTLRWPSVAIWRWHKAWPGKSRTGHPMQISGWERRSI